MFLCFSEVGEVVFICYIFFIIEKGKKKWFWILDINVSIVDYNRNVVRVVKLKLEELGIYLSEKLWVKLWVSYKEGSR